MPITIESRPLSSRSTPVENSDSLGRLRRVLQWYGIARTLYAAVRRHRGASRGLFRSQRRSPVPRPGFARSAGVALGAGLLVYIVLTLARHLKRNSDAAQPPWTDPPL